MKSLLFVLAVLVAPSIKEKLSWGKCIAWLCILFLKGPTVIAVASYLAFALEEEKNKIDGVFGPLFILSSNVD